MLVYMWVYAGEVQGTGRRAGVFRHPFSKWEGTLRTAAVCSLYSRRVFLVLSAVLFVKSCVCCVPRPSICTKTYGRAKMAVKSIVQLTVVSTHCCTNGIASNSSRRGNRSTSSCCYRCSKSTFPRSSFERPSIECPPRCLPSTFATPWRRALPAGWSTPRVRFFSFLFVLVFAGTDGIREYGYADVQDFGTGVIRSREGIRPSNSTLMRLTAKLLS